MYKNLLKICACLLLSSSVFAQSGNYVAGELGSVFVNSIIIFPDTNSGFTGRVSAGHLWGETQTNYGLESGVTYFSHAPQNNFLVHYADSTIYNGYMIDLYGVLKHTFDTNIILFGKVGLGYLYQQATTHYQYMLNTTTSGSKITPAIAFGIGYRLTQQLELNLTSSIFTGSSPSITGNPVAVTSTLLLGLSYHF